MRWGDRRNGEMGGGGVGWSKKAVVEEGGSPRRKGLELF